MNTICEHCQAKNSIIEEYTTGEVVCTNCGTVYDDHLISDVYGKGALECNKNKTIGTPEMHEQDTGPGTFLTVTKNGKTKVVGEHQKETKEQKYCKKIQHFLSNADITDNLIKKTQQLYIMMAPYKNMQGRNFNHIILALYYYASRVEGVALSFREIANRFSSIKEKQIRKAFNDIKCYVAGSDTFDEFIKVEKSYISSYTTVNQIKNETKELSKKIVENINQNSLLEGKNPNTIAGISLLLSYKLLNDNLDNSEEFFKTFSNKATLSKAFEEIKWSLDKIIPQEYSEQIEMIKNLKI